MRWLDPSSYNRRPWTAQIIWICFESLAVPQMAHLQANTFFQQDGVPPHCGLTVREALNTTYPNRRTGRGGWMAWPPRTPDVMPLDSFGGELCKGPDIPAEVGNMVELLTQINSAVASVTSQMLENPRYEIEYGLDILRATNGARSMRY
jgi:hypothetical protein